MDLRRLRYFAVIGDEEHFGRAAERLHVTQAAISHVIHELERELGVPLFDRVGRGVRLNSQGKLLHGVAQRILGDLDRSLEMVRRSARGEVGRLRIAYSGYASLDPLMVEIMKRYRDSNPGVAIELEEMNTWQQGRAFEVGKIDAGFMYPVTNEPGLEFLQLRLAKRAVAFPADHPKLKKSGLTLADLADESFVLQPRTIVGAGYDAPLSACLGAGFEPRIVQEASSGAMLLQLVAGGIGITFINVSGFERLPAGIVVRRVKGLQLWTRFTLAWRREARTLSPLLAFVETAHSVVSAAASGRPRAKTAASRARKRQPSS